MKYGSVAIWGGNILSLHRAEQNHKGVDWLQHTVLFCYLIVHCILVVTNMTFKTRLGRVCLHYVFNLWPQFQKRVNKYYLLSATFLKTCIGSIKLVLTNSPFLSKVPMSAAFGADNCLGPLWLLWEGIGCVLHMLLVSLSLQLTKYQPCDKAHLR